MRTTFEPKEKKFEHKKPINVEYEEQMPILIEDAKVSVHPKDEALFLVHYDPDWSMNRCYKPQDINVNVEYTEREFITFQTIREQPILAHNGNGIYVKEQGKEYKIGFSKRCPKELKLMLEGFKNSSQENKNTIEMLEEKNSCLKKEINNLKQKKKDLEEILCFIVDAKWTKRLKWLFTGVRK